MGSFHGITISEERISPDFVGKGYLVGYNMPVTQTRESFGFFLCKCLVKLVGSIRK